MNRQFSARRLDVKAFAEDAASLQGDDEVAGYTRLLAETAGRGGAARVEWSATGELRNPHHVQPEIWLHLRADTLLPLTCQRCLQPVDVEVEVDRSFRFVADEDTAAAMDEQAEEEDVLALSRAFDLPSLVEDELLMALPIAPRHDVCPEAVNLSAQDEDFEAEAQQRENPFAVLGKLKAGKSGG